MGDAQKPPNRPGEGLFGGFWLPVRLVAQSAWRYASSANSTPSGEVGVVIEPGISYNVSVEGRVNGCCCGVGINGPAVSGEVGEYLVGLVD